MIPSANLTAPLCNMLIVEFEGIGPALLHGSRMRQFWPWRGAGYLIRTETGMPRLVIRLRALVQPLALVTCRPFVVLVAARRVGMQRPMRARMGLALRLRLGLAARLLTLRRRFAEIVRGLRRQIQFLPQRRVLGFQRINPRQQGDDQRVLLGRRKGREVGRRSHGKVDSYPAHQRNRNLYLVGQCHHATPPAALAHNPDKAGSEPAIQPRGIALEIFRIRGACVTERERFYRRRVKHFRGGHVGGICCVLAGFGRSADQ